MSSAETEGVVGARAGDILGGKYRVEKVLGAGGMGVVVAATHLQLDEKVAIKFLLPDAAKSADTVNRFQREARAAVKIKSEHVARVIDVGQLENGSPFMVMEYLQGKDLADTIEAQGGQSIAASVEYVLQACEALAEAHAAGIVHRDLKPANLFLAHRADGSPCIKVLDFGISKMLNSASMPGMTRTTAVMGSPLYMSPEQMKSSKDVDHRTDIWSLGAILYELLAGNPPFIADTMPQLCIMILQEPLPPISLTRRDIPPQLEAVIRKCQEKDPNHRYQNVAELSAALAPFVSGRARMSAERIADVLRTQSSARSSGAPGLATPVPPQAGAPPQAYSQSGSAYGPPGPTVAGAPYGSSSSPDFTPGYGAQTGPSFGAQSNPAYLAHAQSSGNFTPQFGSTPPPGAAATVVGGPAMHGMGTTGPGANTQLHHGPPMAANTASSWEGSLGAPRKKSSAGILIGAVAGVALLAGVGIAVMMLGGGSKDGGAAANNTLLTPAEVTQKPASVVPAVTPGGDTPTAIPQPTAVPEPVVSTGTITKPGKPGKPATTASASASATATAAPTITSPPLPSVTTKPAHPVLEDDRK